jgi:succinate dehydrogenase hydrophobic anchor subunit
MTKSKQSDLNTFLKVDYKEDNSIWLTNSLTLRKIIGVLGMAMPLLLYVFLYFDNGLQQPLESISHYYYTRVSGIFVIILSLLAFFLIVYKGKEPIDFYISLFAGIFALLVVLFPTNNITETCCDSIKKYAVTFLPVTDLSTFRMYFHYTVAGFFFICLSYMSFFLFTKSSKSPSERGAKKTIRNGIYRTCGILMLLAILVLFAGSLKIISASYFKTFPLTFWMETLAIESFGFAWLVKGETLFKD